MESLYARDTPTAQERKLKLAECDQVLTSQEGGQVVQEGSNIEQQSTETFDTSTESSGITDNAKAGVVSTLDSTANPTDDAFGFNFARVELQQPFGEEWRTTQITSKPNQKTPQEPNKTEEGRLAELSEETTLLVPLPASKSENPQQNQQETTSAAASDTTLQSRRAGVASVHRKPKPAITINTGSESAGVGVKRPPPTPVSPPTFSWNDILRIQNLIERCLQQYLSKNDILIILNEQADVDPAFANVVWQKLEEQNPTFFRAYNLQLQLKEQIIAFNYLVGQQKEMTANGSKRVLHYRNLNRSSASQASRPCSLITAPTSTALPPISMDARTLLSTPICSAKQHRTPTGKRAYNQRQHTNMYQLGSSSIGLGATSSDLTTLPPPSPLPLPSPIKTDLDTHAFFT